MFIYLDDLKNNQRFSNQKFLKKTLTDLSEVVIK